MPAPNPALPVNVRPMLSGAEAFGRFVLVLCRPAEWGVVHGDSVEVFNAWACATGARLLFLGLAGGCMTVPAPNPALPADVQPMLSGAGAAGRVVLVVISWSATC